MFQDSIGNLFVANDDKFYLASFQNLLNLNLPERVKLIQFFNQMLDKSTFKPKIPKCSSCDYQETHPREQFELA